MSASRGVAGACAAIVAFVLLIAIVAVDSRDTPGSGDGGILNATSVPAEFGPWLQKAGALCPRIAAPLLAAQLAQESGFNTQAVSSSGAQGPAQFMPGTWPSWGRDEDGNGQASPVDIADAVMAQGRYMCALAAQMAQALDAGTVTGSITDLALAAYNAGPGGVLRAGGVPRNGETDTYVARINSSIGRYGGAGQPGVGGPGGGPGLVPNDGSFASNIVLAAQRMIGQPYVWGGGGTTGPTAGGFDCSGLTMHAVYEASGGTIQLPHNAAAQAKLGTPLSGTQLRPGDLLFFSDTPAAPPHHVGVYVGAEHMVDAPQTGVPVRVTNLATPYYRTQTITARRMG